MPTYVVKDPESGLTVRLTGESPPTETELEDIFSTLSQKQPEAPSRLEAVEDKARSIADKAMADPYGTALKGLGLTPVVWPLAKALQADQLIPPVKLPVVGEEGTFTRGVSKVASGLVEGAQTPEGIGVLAASQIPGAQLVVGPVMAAAAAKEAASKAGEFSVTGSRETLGEALATGTLALGAGLLGVRDFRKVHTPSETPAIPPIIKEKAPATAAVLERTVIENAESLRTGEGPLPVERTVSKGVEKTRGDVVERTPPVQPESLAKGAEAEVTKLPTEQEFWVEFTKHTGGTDQLGPFPSAIVAEKVAARWKENDPRTGKAGYPDSKVITKNKPVPPATEQAPVSPTPTAAAVSEAKTPGVTAPEMPPAIREATIQGQIQQGGSPTSIKNAVMNAERVARGLEPISTAVRRDFGTVWDDAMRLIDQDPAIQDRLVSELKAKPRALTGDTEVALLTHRRVEIKNEVSKAGRELTKAVDEGRLDEVPAINEKVAFWSDKLNELDSVTEAVGTEQGRGLRARKMMVNEDFTLAELINTKRTAKGGAKLTQEETLELQRMADEYAALEKRAAEKDARISELEADKALAEMQASTKASSAVIQVAEKIVTALEKQADLARKRLAGKFMTPSPQDMLDAAIIGASHIGRLGLDFAKWSEKMIEDLGPRIRPYLQEIYESSQKHLDSIAGKMGGRKSDQAKERIKSPVTPETISAKIRKESAEKPLDAFGREIQKLARYFVEQGVKTRDELVSKVHEVLVDVFPEITKSETRDAISGYGKVKLLTKDEISVTLRDLKGQMQQIAKLEDMEAGQAPRKTGIERRSPSDEERRLIKRVNEKKKEGGFTVTDPETQLRSALQAIKTRLENQIKDLEHQIETKQKIVKTKRTPPSDAETNTLRSRRDELKEQFDEMFPPEPLTEAQRLAKWKQNTLRNISKYEKRIAEGDYAPRKRTKPTLDEEAIDIAYKQDAIRQKFFEGVLKDKMAQRYITQRIVDFMRELINFQRALRTSLDFSAVLRQGGFIVFGHWFRGAKSVPAMLRAFRSKEAQFRTEYEIKHRPNYAKYKEAGLELSEIGSASLTKMEEAYMSRWADKVPIVAGSQRSYVTFLNKLRADSFDAGVKTLSLDGKNFDPIQARIWANYVNTATGRGRLGVNDNMAVGMNTLFFAPKYVLSRFQLAVGHPIWYGLISGKAPLRGTMKVRGLIALEYLRALMGLSTVYALGSLAGADIELDPRSSDFMKLRFGNTRVDPLFGLQQVIVLTSRVGKGEIKTSSGKIVPIRGDKVPYGGSTVPTVVGRFGRSKLSPLFSTAFDAAAGENVVGEKVTPASTLSALVIPLSADDLLETMEEQGIPKGLALYLLSIGGMGLQTYDRYKK